jgi:hypothetical protein
MFFPCSWLVVGAGLALALVCIALIVDFFHHRVCLFFACSSSLLVLMEALINFADSKKKYCKFTYVTCSHWSFGKLHLQAYETQYYYP